MRAKIDEAERELMNDFRRARDESVGSGARGGEDSLRGKGEEKGDDRYGNEIEPFLATDESENKKNKDGDGISINRAAGKG